MFLSDDLTREFGKAMAHGNVFSILVPLGPAELYGLRASREFHGRVV